MLRVAVACNVNSGPAIFFYDLQHIFSLYANFLQHVPPPFFYQPTPLPVLPLSFLSLYSVEFPIHTIHILAGTSVVQVSANDPDGADEALTYMLTAGARDNFIMNSTTGEIAVAKGAGLDRDITPKYKVNNMG